MIGSNFKDDNTALNKENIPFIKAIIMNQIYIVGIVFLMGWTSITMQGCRNVGGGNYDASLDTIFLGLNFGMKRQEFYDRCMELNKSHQTTQGTQNTSVLYIDKENFKLPVDMNFYPNFYEDRIYAMPVYFNYKAWAPWNRDLQSDNLLMEVKTLMEKWYGKGFQEKKLNSGKVAFYKIDGPRIITIKMRDEQYVDVLIENTRYAQEPKK